MGVGGAQNWKAETKYKANSLVYTNEKLYICMEDHTSGTDFATDLLSGKWKFIGNGVGSNVTHTEIYSPSSNPVFISALSGQTNYPLKDNGYNYDYLVVTVCIKRKSDNNFFYTEVILPVKDRNPKGNGTIYTQRSFNFDSGSADYNTAGWVNCEEGYEHTIIMGLRRINTSIFYGACVYRVVGIKIQELTTDYIANLAMPSDVYESITLNGETGVKFVAPYDGYIGICVLNNSTKVSCIWGYQTENNLINGKRTRIVATPPLTTKEYYAVVYFPVKKDGVWFLHKIDNNNLIYSNFFYTVGAAKALGLID